jgi:linoleoyl-CoA desaturase
VTSDHLVVKAASLMVLAVSTLGISTNTHTSSHYATSDRRWLNEVLTYFGYPFWVGFSATYWWHKHLVVHHPAPNVIGVDDDANLLPFFAVHTGELQGISRPRRLYYRLQWAVIPLAIFLNSFNMQFAGWRHLIRALRTPVRRRAAHGIDLAALLLHWIVWVFLPMVFFPPAQVLAFYVLRGGFFSYALFGAFAPAHFPPEALFVDKDSKDVDHLLLYTSTTVNFRTRFIGRLLCAGVDYQVEHHLFPAISHVHYPAVSRVVEAYCRAHGYPYRRLGWGEALVKTLLVFCQPKPVHTLVGSDALTSPSS